MPCAPGAAGGAPPADKEAELKAQANTVFLPEWQLRLSNALMQPIKLEVDINTIVDPITDAKARVKVLKSLVVGAQTAVEQSMAFAKSESTDAIVEAVVQAVELVTVDPTVRTDIAAQIKRVVFVPCSPEVCASPCRAHPESVD